MILPRYTSLLDDLAHAGLTCSQDFILAMEAQFVRIVAFGVFRTQKIRISAVYVDILGACSFSCHGFFL